MAEEANQVVEEHKEDEEDNPNYKPPAPKSLDEIVSADAEDESLRKYKEALLGGAAGDKVIVDANNPNKVIINKISLLVDGRDEVSIDLTRTPEEIKKDSFTLKEGCKYRMKIYFHVQREIVSGLKYHQKVYKSGIKVDSMSQMMGSYPPKSEMLSFTTQEEEAPSGMLKRGSFKIESKFIDDDKFEYVSWKWNIEVKKDW